MSQMTNYTENALLNHILANTALTAPTSLTIGLFTASPGETGTTAPYEIAAANGYSRKAIDFAAASGGACATAADVSWTASGGTFADTQTTPSTSITHIGIFDNSGNMLFYGALSSAQTVNDGDTLTIAAGNLTITFN